MMELLGMGQVQIYAGIVESVTQCTYRHAAHEQI